MTDPVLAAKNIKAELKDRFPGVRFRVTSHCFSGGNAVHVKWHGGPTTDQVDPFVRKYEAGYFDGRSDSYEWDEDPQRNEFRRIRGSAK